MENEKEFDPAESEEFYKELTRTLSSEVEAMEEQVSKGKPAGIEEAAADEETVEEAWGGRSQAEDAEGFLDSRSQIERTKESSDSRNQVEEQEKRQKKIWTQEAMDDEIEVVEAEIIDLEPEQMDRTERIIDARVVDGKAVETAELAVTEQSELPGRPATELVTTTTRIEPLPSEKLSEKKEPLKETSSEETFSEEVSPAEEKEQEEEELPELNISDDLFRVDTKEDEFYEKEPADEVLVGINAALAEQIEHEFGKDQLVAEKEPDGRFKMFWKKVPRWCKVVLAVLLFLFLLLGFLFGTKPGRKIVINGVVGYIFNRIHVEPDPGKVTDIPGPGGQITEPLPQITDEPTPTEDPQETPAPTAAVPTGTIVEDTTVINILLIGEENMFGGVRGRSDSMLIASMDKDGGPLKLISLLRDTYVRIPGRLDDEGNTVSGKLNAAYTYGGAPMLINTIEENFKIRIDGYVTVSFTGFETIIDKLGGLTFSLTAQESNYLNTTKYISKVEERNTRPGLQTLTGAQVLGYCRVRKVPTADGKDADFGRTARQRQVLQLIVEKCKKKNLVELYSLMNTCFSYVTASESLKEVAADCLQLVIENKMFELETMQIPYSGKFSETKIKGELVLVPLFDNIDILHDFLYREE